MIGIRTAARVLGELRRDIAAAHERDPAVRVAGLRDGWDALSGFGTAAATVAGALLPWAVVALVVGVPGLALTRRLRRRTAAV